MFRIIIPSLTMLILLSGCSRELSNQHEDLSDLFTTIRKNKPETAVDDWSIADSPRQFTFPADHGSHEDFRIEWWYYTGNLVAKNGRRFGFQLTFFRTGLHKEPANPSRWSVRNLYTAHFAISDMKNRQHFCFQRNSRRGIGQAGAASERYEVWNGDWKVRLMGDTHSLQAAESDVGIDLMLSPEKPPVLHGSGGLSRKGATPGNASYYYSVTRLSTTGTVRMDDQTFDVKGFSWMDHEFSTSFLEPGQLGWDWLAIQLDNDVDLMLYRMRRRDGSTDPFSSGSLIDAKGELTQLSAADIHMNSRQTWQSSATGATYPLVWHIEIPSAGYRLDVRPCFQRQEMTTGATTEISYWEGAVEINGNDSTGKVTGRGYMELTGYTGPGLGELFDYQDEAPEDLR